jgi:hypothetical protein
VAAALNLKPPEIAPGKCSRRFRHQKYPLYMQGRCRRIPLVGVSGDDAVVHMTLARHICRRLVRSTNAEIRIEKIFYAKNTKIRNERR